MRRFLILSAVEGIQSQTDLIWSALKEKKIPVILFINKVDRAGSDVQSILDELRMAFSSNIYPLQALKNEESDKVFC